MLRAPPPILAVLLATVAAAGEPQRTASPRPPLVLIDSFTAGGTEHSLVRSSAGVHSLGKDSDPFRSYEAVRLPINAQPLDLRIAPNPETAGTVTRIQYRLEGWDDEWQDVDGRMWVTLRFLDEGGREISGLSLPRAGQSPGWTGDPNSSRFRLFSETVVAPPRARQMQLVLNSGPPQATGIWLIRGLRIVSPGIPGQQERVLLDEHIEQGAALQERQGVPSNWHREGANMGAPQVFTFNTPPGIHALALIDKDVGSSGRWACVGRNIVDVVPGRPIRIDTEEAFSIGGGGSFVCSYHRLPAGHYTFRVIPANELGAQSGVGVRLALIVVPPFYATRWFWVLSALCLIGVLTGTVRYVTWKRLQRELERSESRRLIEQERIRIARDIHDDMGARLTQISLVSNLALRNTPPESANYGELKRLDGTVREITTALDEIVWAVNPAHDTLEGLGNYISQFATEIVEGSPLRCRLDIPTLLPVHFVSSRMRHHLLMAVKEALGNALKHSRGSEVRVRLEFAEPTLTISISDDGRCFDPEATRTGNGMVNMKARLAEIGGTCTIQRTRGGGACVTFTVPLPAEAAPA